MNFREYVIAPLRNFGEHCKQCEPHQAEFWGLYGIDEDNNAYAIGDFANESDAEFIRGALCSVQTTLETTYAERQSAVLQPPKESKMENMSTTSKISSTSWLTSIRQAAAAVVVLSCALFSISDAEELIGMQACTDNSGLSGYSSIPRYPGIDKDHAGGVICITYYLGTPFVGSVSGWDAGECSVPDLSTRMTCTRGRNIDTYNVLLDEEGNPIALTLFRVREFYTGDYGGVYQGKIIGGWTFIYGDNK